MAFYSMPKCVPHGIEQPCGRCVVEAVWKDGGGKGKPPGSMIAAATKRFAKLSEPLEIPDVKPPAACPRHPGAMAAACAICVTDAIKASGDPLASIAEALAQAVKAGIAIGKG